MLSDKPKPILVPLVERAFQLARSGGVQSIEDVAAHLDREGYVEVEEHMWCPLLRQQLRCAMRGAKAVGTVRKGQTISSSSIGRTTSAEPMRSLLA